jgi:hypothetical protein
MMMITQIRLSMVAVAVAWGVVTTLPAAAQSTDLSGYKSAQPAQGFSRPEAAVDAFKAALAANDFDALARLVGLDPSKLRSSEGVMDTFERMKRDAATSVAVEAPAEDRRIVDLGGEQWPFPFPISRDSKGVWAFNTEAGIEEIINRRIGENELEAIDTARAYVEAQKDYASEDRDGDGVLEYAQKLISADGQADGLYWPADAGFGDSPAGASINQAALEKAKQGQGYFGYRFRILTGQGPNVAGGRYDYVINGNMIAGFGLIAWPVAYGQTGVKTFVVNQAGIVYEKDLGPDTAAIAAGIRRFVPDKSWTITNDE